MKRVCSHNKCGRKHWAKGYCNVHLYRSRNGVDMDKPITKRRKPIGGSCTHEGCNKKHVSKGYCIVHYRRHNEGLDMDAPVRATNTNSTAICGNCNKEYRIRPYQKEITKYCSRSCVGQQRTGDRCGAWKGGITEDSLIKRPKFQKSMRVKVMERDGYKCTICEDDSSYLHVDHIERWSDNEDLRFEMSNCRTVCVPCHYKITFGKSLPEGSSWGIRKKSRKLAIA